MDKPKVGSVVKVHWIDAMDHPDTWTYRKDGAVRKIPTGMVQKIEPLTVVENE